MQHSQWNFMPIQRVWSFGYKQIQLMDWFNSIPSELNSTLRSILVVSHQILHVRISRFKALQNLIQVREEHPRKHLLFDSDINCIPWEEDGTCAYLHISYDADTQEKRDVKFNSDHAKMMGMQNEELYIRFKNFDLELPSPDLDFLYLLVDEIFSMSDQRSERYFRMYTSGGDGTARSAVLVHCLTTKTFNSVGQVTEVRSSIMG
jgi:hypothetical protein